MKFNGWSALGLLLTSGFLGYQLGGTGVSFLLLFVIGIGLGYFWDKMWPIMEKRDEY